MPKRKAEDLEDGASLHEPRRSSRRVSTPKEQQTSKPIAKKAGKVKKARSAGKEHDAEVKGEVEESEELVSLNGSSYKHSFKPPEHALLSNQCQHHR